MKKLYVSFSIIALFIIICFQYNYLAKEAISEYVLNTNHLYYLNDVNNVMFDKYSKLLLQDIDEDCNISFLYNEDTDPYNFSGLEIYILKYNLLNNFKTFWPALNSYKDAYNIKDTIENNDIKYIIFMGKDSQFYNITTDNDMSLLEVVTTEPLEFRIVKSYKYGLYDLYTKLSVEETETTLQLINQLEDSIINDFNFDAISLIWNFANDLYLNGLYEDAIKYSNFYINNVDYIDNVLNMNLGYYYKSIGDYDSALKYFGICTRNDLCDIEKVNQEIDNISKEMS